MADRTPRSVALVSASLITGLLALTYFLVVYFLEREFEIVWLLLFVILGFCISYFVVAYFIERFIYRKVKIIYRTIHNLKNPGKKPKVRMDEDVLGTVNMEVLDWAEEKIREVKSLQATETFRREFIGNLAHELKTPVFNIQGFIDTLIESDELDPSLTKKFLKKASANVERMTDLLKDLDQISEIESGSMTLKLSRFNIVELSRRVAETCESMAAERNIALNVASENNRSVFVMADYLRIDQVITNLVQNSIMYGKPGGQTKINFYDLDDHVLIEVSDNGLGISAEHLPRIFERFYRVDKSRSRNEGGSGLGLAICKHIVESHGQSISVKSTEGKGSSFSFTLRKD